MALLNTLSTAEIKAILGKYFAMTKCPIWVTDKYGQVVVTLANDTQFDFNNLNQQVLFTENDKGICLTDSYQEILHKTRVNRETEFVAEDWLIGLTCSNGTLVWAYPLGYFNELLGFVLLSGLTFDAKDSQNPKLKTILSICNDPPLQAEQPTTAKVLPLSKFTDWLNTFAQVGEELVDHIHHRKLSYVRREVISILKQAHKTIQVEPPRVRITDDGNDGVEVFKRGQQWITSVYHQLCQTVKEKMAVDHFAILILQAEHEKLIVLGSSEKPNPNYRYDIHDANDSGKVNAQSVDYFIQFKATADEINANGLTVKMINDISLKEEDQENLRDLFNPLRGLWAPMMIQGRCVGILRLLVDEKSLPFKPLHQQLFADFASELNEQLETVISHYREAILTDFPPLFAQLKCYQPAFFKAENPFAKVAQGVRLLLNCRAVIIRIKDPQTGELALVGCSKIPRQMHKTDQKILFNSSVLTNAVIKHKKTIHYTNIQCLKTIQLDMCLGDQIACDLFSATENQALHERIEIYKKCRFKSLKSIPVLDENNEVIGLINVFQGEYLAFTAHDENGLLELAVHLSSFIQVRRLHERLESHKAQEIKLRQFYESLIVEFNQAQDEQQLFDLVHRICSKADYFQRVEVWRCDHLYNFPFMEKLYQANAIKGNKSKHSEYKALVKKLVSQITTAISNCEKAKTNAELNDEINDEINDYKVDPQKEYEILQFWLTTRLAKPADLPMLAFMPTLLALLLAENDPRSASNILFPGDHRYFDVKRVLHRHALAKPRNDRGSYRFYYCGEDNQTTDIFYPKEKQITNYLNKLRKENAATDAEPRLLAHFNQDCLPADPNGKNAIWLPLVDKKCQNLYGLCRFIVNKEIDLTAENSKIPPVYGNLMSFVVRTLSSQLEKIWHTNTDHAVMQISDLFDIGIDPQVFFHQAAALIKDTLQAQACIIHGSQSMQRDALVPRGYAGFTLSQPSFGQANNAFLDPQVYNELKTTTHFAFKQQRPLLLANIKYHHYCRVKYIHDLEAQLAPTTLANPPTTIASYCAVPIVHAGIAIGLVELFNKQHQHAQHWFGQRDKNLLMALAEKLGQELSNYEQVREADARVASIVHGSRSPLNAIKGYAFNLKEWFEDNPPASVHQADKDVLTIPQAITNTVDLAEYFIQTTMNEARSKYGPIMEETESDISFTDLLTDISQLFKFTIKQQQLTLDCDPASLTDLTFHGSKKRLMLLITNLLENALKYADQGSTIKVCGVKETVEIAKDSHYQHYVGLSIQNIGCQAYVNEEEQQNLFRSFYRGRQYNNRNGAGMGLPLCKRLVEYYFGRLVIDSTPTANANPDGSTGYQTTVRFYLNTAGHKVGN